MPAVTDLKTKAVYDGHPATLIRSTNTLSSSTPSMPSKPTSTGRTRPCHAYDDCDGWYDHQMDPIVNQSQSAIDDQLIGAGLCGTNTAATTQGRCGYGPRTPLLVISPYARQNYVDHRITDRSSIVQFIETNWSLPAIGGGSTDVKAGSLLGMFDFTSGRKAPKLTPDPTTSEVAE